jgi:UDP-glucose:(heptosyl)LPS alpha-1,3-glucosyltransferase
VYNGVDLDRFHPDHGARLRRPTREALGLSDRDWLVLFVGSGFERKGLGPLIEGLARLGDRRAGLVVAGKGDAAPYQLRAAALGLGSRIRWLGPRTDIERLYAMADAVALPARYEPFGNVHLEALASGLPVLTSTRAGGAEIVDHGQNGWVVGEPDAAGVVEGLEALRALDPARARTAARKAAEPFTYAAQVDALVEIYRRLGSA